MYARESMYCMFSCLKETHKGRKNVYVGNGDSRPVIYHAVIG